MKPSLRRSFGWLIVVVTLAASCAGEPTANEPRDTGGSASNPYATPARAGILRFPSDDGTELLGRLLGKGAVGVVLAHGFSQQAGQDTWGDFPELLAAEGYRVLTFNFRGFCSDDGCSVGSLEPGKYWLDVVGAIELLRERGVNEVLLIGGSMGGIAVLRAAGSPGVDVAGVVSLSTPQFAARYYTGEDPGNDLTPDRIRAIDEPMLFIAGKQDVQRTGEAPLREGVDQVLFAEDARRMFEAASQPKDLLLVDSSSHSSDLVAYEEDQVGERVREAIYAFLQEHSGD